MARNCNPADNKRIVLSFENRPDIGEVFRRLVRKTGMRNGVDLMALALLQLDATLPEPQTTQPMENKGVH